MFLFSPVSICILRPQPWYSTHRPLLQQQRRFSQPPECITTGPCDWHQWSLQVWKPADSQERSIQMLNPNLMDRLTKDLETVGFFKFGIHSICTSQWAWSFKRCIKCKKHLSGGCQSHVSSWGLCQGLHIYHVNSTASMHVRTWFCVQYTVRICTNPCDPTLHRWRSLRHPCAALITYIVPCQQHDCFNTYSGFLFDSKTIVPMAAKWF